jgi:hypothetical protein
MISRSRSARPDLVEDRHQIIHEPSAWMRGAAAKRVRQISAQLKGIDTSAYGAIVSPLGWTGAPGSRADRSCDRCFRYVREGDLLHLFTYQPTPQIHLIGGLCGRCAAKEGAR